MRCKVTGRNADLEFFWKDHEEKNRAGAKDQHSMSVAGYATGGNWRLGVSQES
jgi:hypothetical protein